MAKYGYGNTVHRCLVCGNIMKVAENSNIYGLCNECKHKYVGEMNIKDEVPKEIKLKPGCSGGYGKPQLYKFVKKYNYNNYLYQNVEYNYYECFTPHELGMII